MSHSLGITTPERKQKGAYGAPELRVPPSQRSLLRRLPPETRPAGSDSQQETARRAGVGVGFVYAAIKKCLTDLLLLHALSDKKVCVRRVWCEGLYVHLRVCVCAH